MVKVKRPINIGDVFWVKDRCWQRKVVNVIGDDVQYYDGIAYGLCSRQHFLTKCPRETKVTPKMIEIAQSVSSGKYPIYLDTVNGIYIDQEDDTTRARNTK